jgi:hypothetical protein
MTDMVTVTPIDPVDATVEQTTYDEVGVATTATVENPLIIADVAERATAQAIVDATPQAVIDVYDE